MSRVHAPPFPAPVLEQRGVSGAAAPGSARSLPFTRRHGEPWASVPVGHRAGKPGPLSPVRVRLGGLHGHGNEGLGKELSSRGDSGQTEPSTGRRKRCAAHTWLRLAGGAGLQAAARPGSTAARPPRLRAGAPAGVLGPGSPRLPPTFASSLVRPRSECCGRLEPPPVWAPGRDVPHGHAVPRPPLTLRTISTVKTEVKAMSKCPRIWGQGRGAEVSERKGGAAVPPAPSPSSSPSPTLSPALRPPPLL